MSENLIKVGVAVGTSNFNRTLVIIFCKIQVIIPIRKFCLPSVNRSSQFPPHLPLVRVIAVVGCDGSGKSTLTTDLLTHFRSKGSTKLLYLGQSSGNIADRIRNLPLIGVPFGRYLVRKAERTHNKKTTSPDTATTLVIYLLSLWRAYKFWRMLTLSCRGGVVITDRYPQAQAPGFYFDGPGLRAVNAQSWLARKLAAHEVRLYQWMERHVPALVIRLNIDADTAHARKPDHKLAMLRDKVAVIPTLHFNGAHILDLDSRDPYEQVLDAALKAASAIPLPAPLAGVVAVVGCDGTGKSTLTADLLTNLRANGSVERCYLGLVSGEMGDKIKHLPVIGIRLERYLAAKAERAQDMKLKLPGTGTALVMHLLSLWRATQLRRVIRLSQRGVRVIADRYPQAEIPGFHYDGPGLTADQSHNWLVRKLVAREQTLYQRMAEQKPMLVIRLNIDAETAHKRKPDHSLAELHDKISVMPRLHFSGARIVDLDTSRPYPEVLSAALQEINTAL